MTKLAVIITGQIRTFFKNNIDLKNVLLRCKKYYKLVYVICVLNSENLEDNHKLTSFFDELDIQTKIIRYNDYMDEYHDNSLTKLKNADYINLKNNIQSCISIGGDPDTYSVRHTWIQYHQLNIGIKTLEYLMKTTDTEFDYIFKTRYDSKYPDNFYPNIPVSNDILDILAFNEHNKKIILECMHKNNIKNIDDLILFNENTRLVSGHIPIEHYPLTIGGRVCYNYKTLQNIKITTNNILYSFNDYYFFSNKNTFMRLSNLYNDSCIYLSDNPDLCKHIFCPESQLILYCLNNNIDIIMYSECFYDTMIYR